jgi:Ran GTPase-activating protein (RanGAP) involved in mRNA processing and transport
MDVAAGSSASESHLKSLAEKARFEHVCEQLRQNDGSVEEIDVGSTLFSLNEERLQHLVDALRLHQIGTLRRLHLRFIELGGRKVTTILAPALKNHTSLQSLQLSDCQDNENLACALGVALFYNKSITSLYCSNCWNVPASMAAMGSLLQTARNLTQLRLCHNHIDVKTARIMAQGLRRHTALRDLDLTGNGMGNGALASVLRGLQGQRSTVQSLTLDFNAFSDEGVQSLALLLTKNISLIELSLFGNQVSSTGAEYLAQALTVNVKLQSLVLSFNQIGDAGAAALAKALTVNTTLTKIWFPSNAIGNEGMLTFAQHLPYMKGLEQLHVGLLLHDEAAQALVNAVRCNMRLSVLHMEKMPEEDSDNGQQSASHTMDFYLRLNRCGRRLLRSSGNRNLSTPESEVPLGLWAHVLAKSAWHCSPAGAPDVLYYWLRAKPELMDTYKWSSNLTDN